jgi:hypothetical protein
MTLCASAFAQSVLISGTVTDFSGAPVANAQVALGTGGLTAKSDAQGKFSLSSNVLGVQGQPVINPSAGQIRNGFLNLHLQYASQVDLAVFTAVGEKISSTKVSLAPGNHALPIPDQNGALIYRLNVGEASRSLPNLAKATATNFYDVLKVSAGGYNNYEAILVGAGAGIDTSGMKVVLLKEGNLPKFSFFVTSLVAMRALSKNEKGFGGDLRYGVTGPGAGLRGADRICSDAAELGLKGSSAKQWRAFLSVSDAGNGAKKDAIDRIGPGPWYDRLGRLVSENVTGLISADRPAGDAVVSADLPNENGEPNHTAGGVTMDNHDVLTASDKTGRLQANPNCADWTSTASTSTGGTGGPMMGNGPMAGHSWPANSGKNWMQAHGVAGCAPSVVTGQGSFGGGGVGDGGGYGGIYCFALIP